MTLSSPALRTSGASEPTAQHHATRSQGPARLAVSFDLVGMAAAGLLGIPLILAVTAWARLVRRKLLGRRPPAFRPNQLNLLILGNTSLGAVQRKGNWSDVLCRSYYNPQGYFRSSTILVFPGEETRATPLPHSVVYEERPIRWGRRWHKTRGTWASITYLLRVLALTAHRPIHLIRAQDPHVQGLAGILVQRLLHVPCAVYLGAYWESAFSRHGEEPVFGFRSRRLRQFLSGCVYRQLAGTFSPRLNDPEFVSYGIRPERIHLMRQEIDTEQFVPLTPHDLAALFPDAPPPRPWIMFVGRLHAEKHPADVLSALAEGSGSAGEGTILLCGDGPERPALERLAAAWGLDRRCRFLGFVPNDRVARLMVSADVIVCPMSGSALAEAAASGTPIVAYDTDWHRTIIRGGETGLLVPYRDTASLRAAIERILQDPGAARRLGEAARAVALQEYRMERIEGLMIEGLRKSYESFFRGRGAPPALHRVD